MTGFLAAIALFIAIATIIDRARTDVRSINADDGAPPRLPNPGARDLHTVASTTLSRAQVPSWG